MEILRRAVVLLAEEGIQAPADFEARLEEYVGWIRRWNTALSLVSERDLVENLERHAVDSLSLARYVCGEIASGARWYDLGSGGGFPAIPVGLACPGIEAALIERGERKARFLEQVIEALGLEGFEVRCGQFPKEVGVGGKAVVTARAIENPGEVQRQVLRALDAGGVFLCQSGAPGLLDGTMFHVEHIEDAWTAAGLRRGALHRIRRLV